MWYRYVSCTSPPAVEYGGTFTRWIATLSAAPASSIFPLCQRYTGQKLKKIGLHFGIRESGVSLACRRVAQKVEKDKKLGKKIVRLE